MTDDPLDQQTFAFIGDSCSPQLPMTVNLEPLNGLTDCMAVRDMSVPNQALLEMSYQTHDELAPCQTTSGVQQQITRG